MTPTTVIAVKPTTGSRRAAWFASALLLAGCAAAAPFAGWIGPAFDWYLPLVCAASILVNLLTCYLVLGQFVVAGTPSIAVLGGGYLFSAVIATCYLASSPGIVGIGPWPVSSSQAHGWLWGAWHLGFPLATIAYALSERRRLRTRPVAWMFRPAVACAAAALAASMTLGALLLSNSSHLPPLLAGDDYRASVLAWPGLGILGINFIALAIMLWRLRARTLLQLWLAVAVLAFSLSTGLGALGGQRYSLGWYLSPVVSLAGAGCVLMALLHEITLLYAKLVSMQAKLRMMVDVDGLTGLANRRRFNATLQQQWSHARREGRPISLIMADIDHFKAYNDVLGHPAGDECLRRVAAAIASAARRPVDLVARYGGEEFALVLPDTDAAGAMQVAARLHKAVHDLQMPQPAEPGACVHVSVGVATDGDAFGSTEQDLLARSDAALYHAKREGRNRVVCAAPLAATPSLKRPPLALAS
jgi:diguanylate cyclase (GGDEF)-like protein